MGGVASSHQPNAARRPLTTSLGSLGLQPVYEETLAWSRRGLQLGRARSDLNQAGWQHRYDGAGRLLERAEALDPTLTNNTPEPTSELGSLTQSHAFSFDSQQNLTAKAGTEAGFDLPEIDLPPDNRNRPTSVGGQPLTWDANGNLTAKGNQRYEYDYKNRLTRVSDSAGIEIATYAYDAMNRRVEKLVGGVPTVTTWNGWQEIEQYENGTLRRRRTYGSGLDEVVQIEADLGTGTLDQTYVPIFDSVGNLTALTGATGQLIERYEYTPFGEREVHVDSTPPEVTWLKRAGNGQIKLRFSEEVSLEALEAAIATGALRIEKIQGGGTVPITSVVADFTEEAQAGRRAYKLFVSPIPSGSTLVWPVLEPAAVVDLFGNTMAGTFTLNDPFPWNNTNVRHDSDQPTVERVSLHPCATGIQVRVEFSEIASLSRAAQRITVAGATTSWSRHPAGSAYGLMSACLDLGAGNHTLSIATGPLDTSGKGLAEAFSLTLPVTDPQPEQLVYTAPAATLAPSTTTGTWIGFDGRQEDAETGWIYFRNRYLDPELGRFVTADPMLYVDGPSMYQFAGYSSANVSDPLGLENWGSCRGLMGRSAQVCYQQQRLQAEGVKEILASSEVQGSLQVVGGLGEAAVGAAATGATAGLAAVPGLAAVAHGSDLTATGLKTLWTGEVQETLTKRSTNYVLVSSGMKEETADKVSDVVDIGAGASASVWSTRAVVGLGTRAARGSQGAGLIGGRGQAPRSGALNVAKEGDGFLEYAVRRPDVDPDGFFDVVGHGSPHSMEGFGLHPALEYLDHRTLAKAILRSPDYSGQPIRLISCSTGACPSGFAQNLANQLGVQVKAPSDSIWAYSDGRLTIGPKHSKAAGQFVDFFPGGRK